MRKRAATLIALTGLLSLAAPGAATAGGDDFVAGEVIVRFQGGGERLLQLPDGVGVREAAQALGVNPSVNYAVPNYLARAAFVPNDPGSRGVIGGWRYSQWNFLPCGSTCGESALSFQAQGGIDAPGAWDTLARRGRGGAKGVKVAVLDTGVAYRSKKPKFLKSPDFSRKQFLPGWDFVHRDKLPLDQDGHGTHITGTIAERTNNGTALTGLAYRARIIPVRVLDAQGLGTAHDISRGVRFAAKHGARVINMSFEFSSAVSSCRQIKSVCRALKFATKKHHTVVVSAAGNSNGAGVAFPGAAPRVIAVGRTTKDGCLADGSRAGPGLDLVAPGGGIPRLPACGSDDSLFSSDAPIFQLTFSGRGFRRFGYPSFYEGTSMAASHVSGVAAMVIASGVLGRRPSRGAIECQLEGTARTELGQPGQPYDPRLFGAGLLDAAAAVASRAPAC